MTSASLHTTEAWAGVSSHQRWTRREFWKFFETWNYKRVMCWGTIVDGGRSVKVAFYYLNICVEFLYVYVNGLETRNSL